MDRQLDGTITKVQDELISIQTAEGDYHVLQNTCLFKGKLAPLELLQTGIPVKLCFAQGQVEETRVQIKGYAVEALGVICSMSSRTARIKTNEHSLRIRSRRLTENTGQDYTGSRVKLILYEGIALRCSILCPGEHVTEGKQYEMDSEFPEELEEQDFEIPERNYVDALNVAFSAELAGIHSDFAIVKTGENYRRVQCNQLTYSNKALASLEDLLFPERCTLIFLAQGVANIALTRPEPNKFLENHPRVRQEFHVPREWASSIPPGTYTDVCVSLNKFPLKLCYGTLELLCRHKQRNFMSEFIALAKDLSEKDRVALTGLFASVISHEQRSLPCELIAIFIQKNRDLVKKLFRVEPKEHRQLQHYADFFNIGFIVFTEPPNADQYLPITPRAPVPLLRVYSYNKKH